MTPFGISIDTQRQTAAVELKAEWETQEKGRSERAKLARDAFLSPAVVEAAEASDANPHKAVPGKAPTKVCALLW